MLRQQNGVVGLCLMQAHAHIHARQQKLLGVGHFGAQSNLAGAFIHRQIGKQQAATVGVGFTVFENHVHLGRLIAFGGGQLAGTQGLAHLQHFVGRLAEVDIERVDLLNGGKVRHIPLPDQRAFCHQRTANAARNGRCDVGVAQVDAGCFHLRARGFFGSHGGIVFLLADRIRLYQRAIAPRQGAGLRQVGLCAAERGAIRGGINREQQLPGLDIAAFFKMAFEQNARRTRANLRQAGGLQPARQIRCKRHRARLHSHYTHFRRGHTAASPCASSSLFFIATAGGQGRSQRQHGDPRRRTPIFKGRG